MIEPRWDIQQIQSYRPPQEGRNGMIRLDFNENIEGCSPVVQQALQSISREIIGQYPEYEKIYRQVG
ncbi:MAG: histidinol-phosphate aminotransferase, partial [Candidatus Heimdallarchaeota archaeon]